MLGGILLTALLLLGSASAKVVILGKENNRFTAKSQDELQKEWNAEQKRDDLLEGDMVLTPQIDDMISGPQKPVRDVLSIKQLLWVGKEIPYAFSDNTDSNFKAVVASAIADFNQYTCIRFIPRTNQIDFIRFNVGNGCWSYVGKVGGEQQISLGVGCQRKGTALHEMMHALGYFHEHTRLDRDSYVQVQWSNLVAGMEGNFEKYAHGIADYLGASYDYASIMHYPVTAFSINGKPTLILNQTLIDPAVTVGQRDGFSTIDIQQLRKQFNCGALTTTAIPPTTAVPATTQVLVPTTLATTTPVPIVTPVITVPGSQTPTTKLPEITNPTTVVPTQPTPESTGPPPSTDSTTVAVTFKQTTTPIPPPVTEVTTANVVLTTIVPPPVVTEATTTTDSPPIGPVMTTAPPPVVIEVTTTETPSEVDPPTVFPTTSTPIFVSTTPSPVPPTEPTITITSNPNTIEPVFSIHPKPTEPIEVHGGNGLGQTTIMPPMPIEITTTKGPDRIGPGPYPSWPGSFTWSWNGRPACHQCSCVNVAQVPSPNWQNNHFCVNKAKQNPGVSWSTRGPIFGMRCTKISQSSRRSSTFQNGFLCVNRSSPYHFQWSNDKPLKGRNVRCMKWQEPHNREWNKGYLCARETN